MLQLYEYNDLTVLITEYILPCLARKTCDLGYYKRDEIHVLLCVSKGLRKCINIPLPEPCDIIQIGGKRICKKHCKATPFYRYVENRYLHYRRRLQDGNIHFSHIIFGNIFKKIYSDQISRHWGSDKMTICCGGKGFKLKRPSAIIRLPPQLTLGQI